MQPVLRILLVLFVTTLLQATSTKKQAVRASLGRRAGQKGRTVGLVLDSSLKNTSMFDSAIANMSLSPWTYRDSCDESRVPMRISHAQCLTSSCLTLQGGGEDAALEAKPIYYQVLVLHRVLRQNQRDKGRRKGKRKYDFRLGTEMITVGCTCVRPNVLQQEHTHF